MKRVILDTNIYGRIVDMEQVEEVRELAEKRRDIIIYGFDIIRKELRNTPRDMTIGKGKYRMVLLTLYGKITKERSFPMSDSVRNLAEDYMKTYKTLFGAVNEKLWNDFLIVACAAIHGLDVVVSDDNNTMMSDYSIKTYGTVNSIKKLKTPQFVGYSEFRRSILL